MKNFKTMKQLLILTIFLWSANAVSQPCSDIFFSEYIEGTSYNKAVEIFNATSADVDISGYTFLRQANGGTVTPYIYSGIIKPGKVFIIANSSANQTILDLADVTSGFCSYSGNDALAIINNASGDTIDRIGVWNQDPGTNWVVGSGATSEFTLVRMKTVSEGTKDWAVCQNQWDVYAQDVITYLGIHSSDSCGGLNTPMVAFESGKQYVAEGKDSVYINLTIVNPNSGATSVEVALSNTTKGVNGTDFNFTTQTVTFPGSSAAAQTVGINLNDNTKWSELMAEADAMNIILKLQNPTNSAIFGNDSMHTIVITDDDFNRAACSYPYFSEYGEGSSNNKYLEIYNPDNMKIDLSQIRVMIFNNGATASSGEITLNGLLDSYTTYIIGNASADSTNILSKADTTHSVTFFNGDDALLLLKGFCDTLDIIGIIGQDPGTSWTVDTGTTVDHTLIRRDTVSSGGTNWTASAIGWKAYGLDYWTNLGIHTQTVCTAPPCPDSLGLSVKGYPDTCSNSVGWAEVTNVLLGTAPYTYLWSTGDKSVYTDSLPAGNYGVVVLDSNGCSDTYNIVITNWVLDSLGLSIKGYSDTCSNNIGWAEVTSVSLGTSPYTYLWSTGDKTVYTDSLSAGVYNVVVLDANGCADSSNIVISDKISKITYNVVINDANCNQADGSLQISNVSGGFNPYMYYWSTLDTGTIITGLVSGNYELTIIDAYGCWHDSSLTVNDIGGPNAVVMYNDLLCFGDNDGVATVSIISGLSPFSYKWSNTATTVSVSGLSSGNHSVSISDSAGCKTVKSFSITEPLMLEIGIKSWDISCNGSADGSGMVSAQGGVSPYSYSWSNGGTSYDISSLAAASYSVTVYDNNMCMETDIVQINEPLLLEILVDYWGINCNGNSDGTATVTAWGGVEPYSYVWSNGDTSSDLYSLNAGIYSITVYDNNMCMKSDTIQFNEPAKLLLTMNGTDVTCYAFSDGMASVTASGGISPYLYSWSNLKTTSSISNISAGIYTVTVTDDNGCITQEKITLTEPDSITLFTNVINESVAGALDGSIAVSITGGTAAYSYSWSNGSSSADINNLSADDYTVTVTDANGCIATVTATVGIGNSILEFIDNFNLNIYPNPASVQITFSFNVKENSVFNIVDVMGKLMYSEAVNVKGEYSKTIHLNDWAAGIYCVHITSDKQLITRKIVVTSK